MRKEIYGKKNYRDRKYYPQNITLKMSPRKKKIIDFIAKIPIIGKQFAKILFTYFVQKINSNTIVADKLRQEYKKFKRLYKEIKSK